MIGPGDTVASYADADWNPRFQCGPCVCRNVNGDIIHVLTAGIASCLCYHDLTTGQDMQITFTGTLNGAFDALFVDVGPGGVTSWAAEAIDTATIKTYASTDGTCTDLTDTTTAPVFIQLRCQDGVMFNATMAAGTHTLFDADNPVQGVAAANALTCDGIHPAGGGTLTWG